MFNFYIAIIISTVIVSSTVGFGIAMKTYPVTTTQDISPKAQQVLDAKTIDILETQLDTMTRRAENNRNIALWFAGLVLFAAAVGIVREVLTTFVYQN